MRTGRRVCAYVWRIRQECLNPKQSKERSLCGEKKPQHLSLSATGCDIASKTIARIGQMCKNRPPRTGPLHEISRGVYMLSGETNTSRCWRCFFAEKGRGPVTRGIDPWSMAECPRRRERSLFPVRIGQPR